MIKDSFPFNLKWCNALLSQPADLRLEIYDAIMTYALSGSIVEMSPLAKMAFSFIKEEMDCNIEVHKKAIEQRRSAVNSRWAKHKAERLQQDNCEPYDRIRNDTKNTTVYEKYDRIQGVRPYNSYDLEKERTKEKEDIYNINNNNILQTNITNKEKKANKKKKVFTKSEQQFEDFRLHYPGIKRGFQIEFDNFKKKHPNWQDILPLLIPAVDRLIAYSEKCRARGQFVAEYPHLQTWLNQSRWEIEYPEVTDQQQNPTNYGTSTLSDYDRRQEEFRQHIIDKLSSPDDDEPDLSDIL